MRALFYGKQSRDKFNIAIYRTMGILDYIYYDFWGPTSVQSKDGFQYYLTFIDNFLKKVWIYILKYKNEVFPTFKKWKALVEKISNKKKSRD